MTYYTVDGHKIACEISGKGETIVWSPGGFWGIDGAHPFSARLVELGYRVVLFDRPTTERSDLVFTGNNIFQMWADNIHALLGTVGELPAIIGGGSGGMLTSLYYAHAYPEDVKALLLVSPPTKDPDTWDGIIDGTFLEPAEVARSTGMNAVIEGGGFFDWSTQVEKRPDKRADLLQMNAVEFAGLMETWGESWNGSGRAHLASLSQADIQEMKTPAIITSGPNPLHPREAAEELHDIYLDSEVMYWQDHFSEAETESLLAQSGAHCDAALAPFLDSFMKKLM